MIYGVEANVINDAVPIVVNPQPVSLQEAVYVVFDIETTGLSVTHNKIIEIAAVKLHEGREIDRYSTFVDPHEKIPYHITKLTNITDDMVKGAPDIETVMPQFVEFVGDAVLVAHNASFDTGFIQAFCKRLGIPEPDNPVLDTLEMARMLYPSLKNHRLNTLCDRFKVSLENHHRAIDDTVALGEVLKHMLREAEERQIRDLSRLNDFVGQDLSNARRFTAAYTPETRRGRKICSNWSPCPTRNISIASRAFRKAN